MSVHAGVVVQPEFWPLTFSFLLPRVPARAVAGRRGSIRMAPGCAAVPTRPGFAGRVGLPRAI